MVYRRTYGACESTTGMATGTAGGRSLPVLRPREISVEGRRTKVLGEATRSVAQSPTRAHVGRRPSTPGRPQLGFTDQGCYDIRIQVSYESRIAMNKDARRRYVQHLIDDANDPAYRAPDALDQAHAMRCPGSKFGRHRFVPRADDPTAQLRCEFCGAPRIQALR